MLGIMTLAVYFFANNELDLNLMGRGPLSALEVSHVDRGFLFYNRVPKAGSSTMNRLFDLLASLNGFQNIHSPIYHKRRLSMKEQVRLIFKVATYLAQLYLCH